LIRPWRLVREESFGPVFCVQSFRAESDAIRLANSTEYGLDATVWARDMGVDDVWRVRSRRERYLYVVPGKRSQNLAAF